MSQYDELAADYHWLYSDYVSSGKPYLEEHDDVLKEAGPKARILDCSCGIGTFVIALAKLGYDVSGSDGSRRMFEQANLVAKSANVDVPLECSTWEDLPAHFTSPFDLIFCLGNSIGHTRNGEEMLRSLKGMRAVLRMAASSSLTLAIGSSSGKRKHGSHRFSGESGLGRGVCPSTFGTFRRGSRTLTR